MVIKRIVKLFFKIVKRMEKWSEDPEKLSIYTPLEGGETEKKEIISVWDVLKFKENTQAYHLNNVIGFEEWIDMEEIRRRVKELFLVEYKNFRSLYPYLKTLVDLGLMETTSAGGRRKWRKVMLLVEANKEEKKKEEIRVRMEKKKDKQN